MVKYIFSRVGDPTWLYQWFYTMLLPLQGSPTHPYTLIFPNCTSHCAVPSVFPPALLPMALPSLWRMDTQGRTTVCLPAVQQQHLTWLGGRGGEGCQRLQSPESVLPAECCAPAHTPGDAALLCLSFNTCFWQGIFKEAWCFYGQLIFYGLHMQAFLGLFFTICSLIYRHLAWFWHSEAWEVFIWRLHHPFLCLIPTNEAILH